MTGNELLRKLRRLGKESGIRLKFVKHRGRGSHGTLFYGKNFAVIPDLRHELKKGTLHAVLKQLGLRMEDMGE